MSNLYKQVIATQGKFEMEVSLTGNNTITVRTTVRMHPKNRKQKKSWKPEVCSMKKVEKGLYEVTQCCTFSLSMFARVFENIIKDKNGELWFADLNEHTEATSGN